MIWKHLKLAIVVLLVGTSLTARTLGKTYEQTTDARIYSIQAAEEVVVEEKTNQEAPKLPSLPKELLRACGCESNSSPTNAPRQFDSKGTPIQHANRDGTTDWGACQINSIHTEEARKLGLNFKYSQADNYKMALWIYKHQGIGAWNGYDSKTQTCSYYPKK